MLKKTAAIYRVHKSEYTEDLSTEISSLEFASTVWNDNPFNDLIEDWCEEKDYIDFEISLENETRAIAWLDQWLKTQKTNL